jgi:hypothetical protein
MPKSRKPYKYRKLSGKNKKVKNSKNIKRLGKNKSKSRNNRKQKGGRTKRKTRKMRGGADFAHLMEVAEGQRNFFRNTVNQVAEAEAAAAEAAERRKDNNKKAQQAAEAARKKKAQQAAKAAERRKDNNKKAAAEGEESYGFGGEGALGFGEEAAGFPQEDDEDDEVYGFTENDLEDIQKKKIFLLYLLYICINDEINSTNLMPPTQDQLDIIFSKENFSLDKKKKTFKKKKTLLFTINNVLLQIIKVFNKYINISVEKKDQIIFEKKDQIIFGADSLERIFHKLYSKSIDGTKKDVLNKLILTIERILPIINSKYIINIVVEDLNDDIIREFNSLNFNSLELDSALLQIEINEILPEKKK